MNFIPYHMSFCNGRAGFRDRIETPAVSLPAEQNNHAPEGVHRPTHRASSFRIRDSRMNRKKRGIPNMNNNRNSLIRLMIMLCGIAATAMIFLPALHYPETENAFTGYESVFGVTIVDIGSIASGQIELNLLGILAYVLPFAAFMMAIFLKRGAIFASLLFVAGAILLFLIPEMTRTTVTILGTSHDLDVDWQFAYGLIAAIVLSVVGAVFSFVNISMNAENG